MVKQRENGKVVGTELRVIYGDEAEVLDLLGKSISYIERTHLLQTNNWLSCRAG